MPLAAILAELAARYPDGYRCFTLGGKRCAEPELLRTRGHPGFWRTNINGDFHLFDDAGRLLSYASTANRILAARSWRVTEPLGDPA